MTILIYSLAFKCQKKNGNKRFVEAYLTGTKVFCRRLHITLESLVPLVVHNLKRYGMKIFAF